MHRVLNILLCSLVIGSAGCQPTPSPRGFLVEVWPNDTIISVDSEILDRPVDLSLLSDGVLQLTDAGARVVLNIEPRGRGVVSADSVIELPSDLWSAGARLADGGRWVVSDSLPRIQRFAPDGALLAERSFSAAELTSIRVNGLYRAQAEGTTEAIRYATDLELVAGRPWVLLNMTVEEGAQILVFDTEGRQKGKVTLPATEGGRHFVVDTASAMIYLTSEAPPQLLGVSLRGHEFLWRGTP